MGLGRRVILMPANTILTSNALRESLTGLWDRLLNIEPHRDGFVFAMPTAFPDGWQMVLEVSQKTPKGFRLSDQGKTLGWLAGQGQNITTEAITAHIQRICAECGILHEGGELYRWLSAPLDAVDIHVFTEGLANISQLHLLHDPRATLENVAETVVERVFRDAGLEPQRNHKMNITKERKISVDFFAQRRLPVAVELVKTKKDFTGTMERWGFRWDKLRQNYEGLVPVMLYDRNNGLMDAYPRHIGEEKCALFCGYDETDRIHELLERIR
jgi:hypothetical protein